jgi:hypothetical protein
MRRIHALGLLVVALAACARSHDSAVVEVSARDCATCHPVAVLQPPHGSQFPDTCGDCHSTTAWRPASGPHPEDRFPTLTGPHQAIGCQDCHDPALAPAYGRDNTRCVGCHVPATVEAQHEGVPGYAFVSGDPRFCLSCHPRGLADVRHPEDRFPIQSGPHRRFACLDCHRPALGEYALGANTDCVGCHTGEHARDEVDREHREVGGYAFDPANPHFCLRCHPRGDD